MSALGDARERALLTDLVYGTLRNQIWLDACLAPRLQAPQRLPEDTRNVLRLAAYELLVRKTPPHAAVDQWVAVVKKKAPRLAGLTNAVLRRVERENGLPWHVEQSLPDWLGLAFHELLGEKAAAAAAGMLAPEPLWLSAFSSEAEAALLSEGCDVAVGPVPGSLAVRSPVPLGQLAAFREGLVQPQNPSSRLPVIALQPAAGERVLDLASGNGIKSAQLAARGARVTAIELDAAKVERARLNLTRLDLEVRHLVADLRETPSLAPAPKVILDAPCSGTGTLRGNPEIKLRLTREDVRRLAELQSLMLDSAAALTAPNGTLVYSVCALTRSEGPDQIDRFLERHPEFTPEPIELPLTPWQRTTSEGVQAEQPEVVSVDAAVVVVPTTGLDGFFISRLRRSAR